ncbi:Myb-like DNA-binding domain-containing protein [Spironucleus salmonicida]|uniref:Myb-like DNA-binding domain-containing protein n=1 Tax=Spironucleus salmonicida TaxID=348837 RepID=V6LAA1_9EUKA|nr:Myb-like DNA-binding domain-containing protein [Spironucleus salmonicida]|eukprot:EST41360.1 Myb-like DNA-binding domain-containing protein [Spironucleus salmonicida]
MDDIEQARNLAYRCILNNPEMGNGDQQQQINICVYQLLETWKSDIIPFNNPLTVLESELLNEENEEEAIVQNQLSMDTMSKTMETEKRHATKDDAWLAIEAEFLRICMTHHPEWGFEKISQEMFKVSGKQRTRQQVHLRWTRVQNPELKKGRWVASEEVQLRQLYQDCNGDVKQISKIMKGRNLVQISKHLKVIGLIK